MNSRRLMSSLRARGEGIIATETSTLKRSCRPAGFLAFEDAIDVDRHFPNNASAAEITSSCGFALQYPDNLSASADSLSRSTTGGPFSSR